MRDMSCLGQPPPVQLDGAKGWWWVWEKAGWMERFCFVVLTVHLWVKLKLHI